MASKNPNAQDLLPVFGVAAADPPAMAPHSSKVKRAGGWREERADRSEVSDRCQGAQVVRARAAAQGETLDAHFQRSKLQRDKGHLLGKEDPYKGVPSKRKHDLREEEARPRTRDRAGEALGKKRASSSRLSANESNGGASDHGGGEARTEQSRRFQDIKRAARSRKTKGGGAKASYVCVRPER